ncbi:MAG: DUF1801 domain-containing protein [Acidobacteriia bacterium]|nr:DUF1801 domain-containing protein [Terriglobia bacterium]
MFAPACWQEGGWFQIGFATNKSYISLYCCSANENGYVAERCKGALPKAGIGRSCLRCKRPGDLDLPMLKKLIRETA